ncbi:hypothetical protein CUMW_232200 [Citrus unshiu]|nr:hypothetical protein CUMW_232200 [Citrus unshiu]
MLSKLHSFDISSTTPLASSPSEKEHPKKSANLFTQKPNTCSQMGPKLWMPQQALSKASSIRDGSKSRSLGMNCQSVMNWSKGFVRRVALFEADSRVVPLHHRMVMFLAYWLNRGIF